MATHIIAEEINFPQQPHTETRPGEVCLGLYSRKNFEELKLTTKRLGFPYEPLWENWNPFKCSISIFPVFAEQEEVETKKNKLVFTIIREEELYAYGF